MKRRVLVTGDHAVPCSTQPKQPCSDCPFARVAIRGWLGNLSVEDWLAAAHGESRIECHTLIGPQCAGAAIYRANVCKKPRDRHTLVLEPNTETVFASPQEFSSHHGGNRAETKGGPSNQVDGTATRTGVRSGRIDRNTSAVSNRRRV